LALRIRELWRAGIEVTLFCTIKSSEEIPADTPLSTWCTRIVCVPRPGVIRGVLKSVFVPYRVASRKLATLARTLESACEASRPQAVILEYAYVAGYRTSVPLGIPVVLGVNNVEWRLLWERARSIGPRPRALAYAFEALRMRLYEWRLLRGTDFAATIFISAEEMREVVAAHPRLAKGAHFLPPGTDLPDFKPLVFGGSPPRFVFVGSLWYDPNVDGLWWFLREVWPIVRGRLPAAELVVAGRGASAQLESSLRAQLGVQFMGEVADVAMAYDRGSAIVIPVNKGAGTKVKAVEALGRSLPCIGTRCAFEGLDIGRAGVASIADTPQQFADACVRAVTDERFARDLATRAYRYASANLSWKAVGGRCVSILEQVVI
jgi:glycosyltransferase involved in cell wall biosynthesis